jgi:hypothetical protein
MREEDFKIVISEWKNKMLPELIERNQEVLIEIDMIISIIGLRQAKKTYRIFNSSKR